MIKVEFNDVKIEVPESWKDIKLAEYEKLYLHHPQTKQEQVAFIAGVCGIDVNLLLDSPTQVFNTIAGIVDFVFESELPPAANVKIDGTEYFISLADKLTLGEWIDVENIITGDSETKLSEMLAILCRPVGEKYNPDLTAARAALFRNLACDKALPLISFFFIQKERIRSDFEPLFNGNGSGKPVSTGYKEFCNKWGWYKTIADLAEDKIHLFDTVTGKTVSEVFGFLLYKIDKSRAEEDQYKFERQIRR